MDDIRVALVGLGRRGVDAWLPLLQHVEGYRLDIAANLFARRMWRTR
jgi:predicted dehydrogenase